MSGSAESLPPPLPGGRRFELLQGPMLRALLVGLIWVLLWIPLGMVDGLRSERDGHARQAQRTIAEGWGGAQLLSGIYLRRQTPLGQRLLLPERQTVSVRLRSEQRQIGIHRLPVFWADVRLEGHFRAAELESLLRFGLDAEALERLDAETPLIGEARLMLGLSDPAGLRQLGQVRVGDQHLELRPVESRLDLGTLGAGLQLNAADDLVFVLELTLAGTQALDFLPFARAFELQASGDWPHPGFGGRMLPIEREVRADGFQARWQVSEFNRPFGQMFDDLTQSGHSLRQSAVGLSLAEPAGTYQQHERALKYAAMFIALALCGFLLVELWLGLPLHPLHYGLAGLTQVMFYLLLLALAEHLGFGGAWLLAAAAVVLLTGSWCIAILRARSRGMLAGGLLAVIYALLYGLIVAEEHSLLLGSLLLFAMLALLMWLTRQIGAAPPLAAEPHR
ncbi:MAG: cell envelope integrity protein CreD [Xanthomonadales bacterium]|jgi:inner membrane protein|nr:cell envelope integrity protein CreD [Xanthomonadales bacterium]